MTGNDWKWHEQDAKESIVVPSVQAVAVYANTDGDIVIRQQNPMGEEDAVIVVPRSSVGAIIKALKAESAKK